MKIPARDFSLQWGESGCCPSPQWIDCFCPHFTERSWCKNGLEQRLAVHRASNVVALTDPQEKNSSHCARKQSPSFSRVVALERQGPRLNRIWTLTQLPAPSQAELQQYWRRARFRAGSGFYNSGLSSGCMWKGFWTDLFCTSVSLSIALWGLLHRHIVHDQLMLQLVCGPGKAIWLPG